MVWITDVMKRAERCKPPVLGGRSDKLGKISFNDIVFMPAQLQKRPFDYFKEKIETKTIIGKGSKKPMVLKMPIIIGAMSFGALSREAKISLAKASSVVGTATNTGEGGMLPAERENAKLLIAQYSTGRFGVDKKYLRSANAIEIKIGQGAKPGQGGLLPKEKLTKEIMKVRKLKEAKNVHSPPAHPDIFSIADLKKKVNWLRKETGGKPIIIKLGAGHVEKDVALAVKANPDAISIDGHSGGTGAAPEVMLNNFGLPTIAAINRARKTLDKLKAKQDLIAGGGINTGADAAKALALGADAVFMGFALLVAMGCKYCKQCYLGKCPLGITSQTPRFRRNLHINKATQKITNFLTCCNEEIKMVAAATGNKNIHKLCRNDLRALTSDMSQIASVKLI